MSLLTTLLLTDSVEKMGKPGSGPHSNAASASRSANQKSRLARITKKKADHLAAARAHTLASRYYLKSGNLKVSQAHATTAAFHTTAANS